jgi:hypothetical protein
VSPKNVSAGGARMFSDDKIDVGKRLDMTITLPRGRFIECRGLVVWTKKLPAASEARYDIGIAFYEMTDEDREHLASYLTEV